MNRKVLRFREEGHHSQYGQDRLVGDLLYQEKKGGVFVEIGAVDGIHLSNSLYLEQERGWTGLLIEPRVSVFEQLVKNRTSAAEQCCVSDRVGTVQFLDVEGPHELSGIMDSFHKKHLERIDREIAEAEGSRQVTEVPCFPLGDLLKKHGITRVDYVSIDTEGSELEILKAIDFSQLEIGCVSVENNYFSFEFRRLMESHGYSLIAIAGPDEVYWKGEKPSFL